jgi:hypothetical protein
MTAEPAGGTARAASLGPITSLGLAALVASCSTYHVSLTGDGDEYDWGSGADGDADADADHASPDVGADDTGPGADGDADGDGDSDGEEPEDDADVWEADAPLVCELPFPPAGRLEADVPHALSGLWEVMEHSGPLDDGTFMLALRFDADGEWYRVHYELPDNMEPRLPLEVRSRWEGVIRPCTGGPTGLCGLLALRSEGRMVVYHEGVPTLALTGDLGEWEVSWLSLPCELTTDSCGGVWRPAAAQLLPPDGEVYDPTFAGGEQWFSSRWGNVWLVVGSASDVFWSAGCTPTGAGDSDWLEYVLRIE